MALEPGDVLGGRYRIETLLGKGGMGAVYRAVDDTVGRHVALKIVHDALDDVARTRFRREAEIVQSLNHPNTVRLFDFGVDGDTTFIVYELLEGETLGRLMSRGPLPPPRALRIIVGVLKALAEAHERGIVHRDIKPGNVMVLQFAGDADVAKVLDFGIAKPTQADVTRVTTEGSIIGTPRFMAPEQARGGTVTPRTDVYAVGLMLCEMLSGERLYTGTPLEICVAQVEPIPVPMPEAVAMGPLGKAIARAVEKDPARRYESAHALLHAVERVMARGEAAWSPAGPQAAAATRMDRPPTAPLTAETSRAPVVEPAAAGRVAHGIRQPTPDGRRAPARWPWIAGSIAALAVGGGAAAVWLSADGPGSSTDERSDPNDDDDSGSNKKRNGAKAAPDPTCTPSGCLRAAQHIGDYDRKAIAATLSPGVTIDNGYSVHTLTFATRHGEARATVTIPIGVDEPSGGYHVVANAHGTTGLDDPCAVAGTIAGAGLAGTFGARGFVGVAVDYPGLGTSGTHPYLVSRSEGAAVIDALRATAHFLKSQGVRLSDRQAVVGVSQGGHAALAAATQKRSRDLDIRAYAVVAPASVFETHWRSGVAVDGPHIPVHAMLIYAWAKHYKHAGGDLWSAAVAPRIDDVMRRACIYSSLGAPHLVDELGTSARKVFSAPFLAAYQSGQWGSYPVFGKAFGDNRIRTFPKGVPLKIYQGDHDTLIPEAATRELVDVLKRDGADVSYEIVPGGTHANIAFGAVALSELRTAAAIRWIRRKLQ